MEGQRSQEVRQRNDNCSLPARLCLVLRQYNNQNLSKGRCGTSGVLMIPSEIEHQSTYATRREPIGKLVGRGSCLSASGKLRDRDSKPGIK